MLENNSYTRLVQKCLLYIASDYMYIVGVLDLAEALGVSKHHLIREFTKNVGISPNKYLIKYKLDQAKILLANEHLSIDAVAGAVGFSCGNYFAKVFKKEFGITPSEYIENSPIVNPSKTLGKIYL